MLLYNVKLNEIEFAFQRFPQRSIGHLQAFSGYTKIYL